MKKWNPRASPCFLSSRRSSPNGIVKITRQLARAFSGGMEPIAADVPRMVGQICPGGMDIDQVDSNLGADRSNSPVPLRYLGAQSNRIIAEKMREKGEVRYIADEDSSMSSPVQRGQQGKERL